jgi:hypothetical protein
MLGDIVSTFLEVMGGLRLPVGSVILLSSMTHLLVEGVDAYTAALIEQSSRLVRAFKGGVVGVPGIPVLLAGSSSPEAVRCLHDYCQWLPALSVVEHGGAGFMKAAAAAVTDTLIAGEEEEKQACYGAVHLLPSDMFGKKQRWHIGATTSLKSGVAPLQSDTVEKIVSIIKSDLNKSMQLDFDVSVGKAVAGPTDDDYGKWRFVLVGASHAARLCDIMVGLNMIATSVGTAGWFPSKKNCDKLESDLREFLEGLEPDPDRETVVIFSMLDKTYFQARSEDGSYTPHRLLEGAYHVDGDLVACPMEHLKYQFELLVPVFKTAGSVRRLLLGPVPRYLFSGCCEDPEHAPNRQEEDFQEKLLDGLEKAKRTMRSLAFKHGMKDMKIINPGRFLESSSLWGTDPVHPTVDGYRILLDSIVGGLDVLSEGDTAKQAEKRPASDQLVGPARRPYWISAATPAPGGQEFVTCNSGGGRGGRGGGRGGRGGRGRWHRRFY